MKSYRYIQGSSMIELMVALFVLAIGLLGALGLQLSSVRSAQSAVFSSDAQIIAQDMMDRILAYNDVLVTTDDDDYDSIDTETVFTDPGCVASGCSLAEQKILDSFSWRDMVRTRLPGGRGTVSYNGGIYTVLVMWDRDMTGASNTGCGGNPAVDLTCYQVEFRL